MAFVRFFTVASRRSRVPGTASQPDAFQTTCAGISPLRPFAEAIPQDKYSWRPGAGVRSVSEAFMHVAGGNYFLMTFAGVTAPAGMSENMDAITDRAQVLDNLKRSFAHARAAIAAASDADLDKPTEMFGQKTTYRNVYLTEVSHAHEHLGQLIAYARMNGITPPWSMPAR